MSTLLEQAVTHIRAGDLETGKKLLLQVIEQNPRDENAWLWMSRCVPTIEQKKECFERVLAINPSNMMASEALENLATQAPSTQKPVNQLPKQSSQAPKKASASKSPRPPKKKGVSPKVWLPIVLALIACCGTVVAAFIGSDNVRQLVMSIIPRSDDFTISVHVADRAGTAIRGAKVLFFYPAGSLSQYTDSNGVSTFAVSNAGQGNLRVIIESDDYQIFEKQVLYPIETTVEARLSEKQGSRENVILRAVIDGSSEPIAGIDIVVSLDGNLYRQTTDSDGFALFELPFPGSGEINTQISVNAQGYDIENQFSTLTPGRLQYVLLTPSSLRVEVPNIPTSTGPTTTSPGASGGIIGSGVEISQQAGASGLKVVLLTPDSAPWNDAWITVFKQETDVTGNPSRGGQVGNGKINLQGEISFDLEAGMYLVCPPELGYGWTDKGCVYNIQVEAGSQTVVKLQPGKIEVTIVDASGNPWEGVWTYIFTQKQSAAGEPVTNNRVWDGRTDNTGTLNAWLTPGLYAVRIDLRGYNWGDLADGYGKANVAVDTGTTTPVMITMGQIIVGLTDSGGAPREGVWAYIYTQKNDVNGNPVLDTRVWDGRTDNGGLATISLTEGLYAIKIDENVLYDVPVNWGVITRTDGTSYQQGE